MLPCHTGKDTFSILILPCLPRFSSPHVRLDLSLTPRRRKRRKKKAQNTLRKWITWMLSGWIKCKLFWNRFDVSLCVLVGASGDLLNGTKPIKLQLLLGEYSLRMYTKYEICKIGIFLKKTILQFHLMTNRTTRCNVCPLCLKFRRRHYERAWIYNFTN